MSPRSVIAVAAYPAAEVGEARAGVCVGARRREVDGDSARAVAVAAVATGAA